MRAPRIVLRRQDVPGLVVSILLTGMACVVLVWQGQQFRSKPDSDLACLAAGKGPPLCIGTGATRTAP